MPRFSMVSPMTASLKGTFEPKIHLSVEGVTLCGKDWREAGWGLIEEIDHIPSQNGDYCARCLKIAQASLAKHASDPDLGPVDANCTEKERKETKITRAITHSGSFHADDLFAYAVLTSVFRDIELIRTRDTEMIATAGLDTIVFDVGNEYDPERQRFDHHQIDKPMRDEGLAYSSFGLIWKHYGLAYVTRATGLEGHDAERVLRRVDARLVRDIDAVDNGTLMPDQQGATHPLTIPSMLADFRPDFDDDDPQSMDRAFRRATFMAMKLLEAKVRKAAASLRSDAIVKEAITNRSDPRWIELPRGMNYQGVIQNSKDEEILFVVNPSGDEWQLNVVTVSRGSYEARQSLPQQWAGLRDAELAAVTGVEDAVFCHTGRFIAIAKSRDGIMKLLEQALEAATTSACAAAT